MDKRYSHVNDGEMPWCEACQCWHHETVPCVSQIRWQLKWKARAPGFLVLAAILACCSTYEHLGRHDTAEAILCLCWAILMMVCYIAFKGDRA